MSLNLPAVELLAEIGPAYFIARLRNAGGQDFQRAASIERFHYERTAALNQMMQRRALVKGRLDLIDRITPRVVVRRHEKDHRARIVTSVRPDRRD
jgi:hypothetical protein